MSVCACGSSSTGLAQEIERQLLLSPVEIQSVHQACHLWKHQQDKQRQIQSPKKATTVPIHLRFNDLTPSFLRQLRSQLMRVSMSGDLRGIERGIRPLLLLALGITKANDDGEASVTDEDASSSTQDQLNRFLSNNRLLHSLHFLPVYASLLHAIVVAHRNTIRAMYKDRRKAASGIGPGDGSDPAHSRQQSSSGGDLHNHNHSHSNGTASAAQASSWGHSQYDLFTKPDAYFYTDKLLRQLLLLLHCMLIVHRRDGMFLNALTRRFHLLQSLLELLSPVALAEGGSNANYMALESLVGRYGEMDGGLGDEDDEGDEFIVEYNRERSHPSSNTTALCPSFQLSFWSAASSDSFQAGVRFRHLSSVSFWPIERIAALIAMIMDACAEFQQQQQQNQTTSNPEKKDKAAAKASSATQTPTKPKVKSSVGSAVKASDASGGSTTRSVCINCMRVHCRPSSDPDSACLLSCGASTSSTSTSARSNDALQSLLPFELQEVCDLLAMVHGSILYAPHLANEENPTEHSDSIQSTKPVHPTPDAIMDLSELQSPTGAPLVAALRASGATLPTKSFPFLTASILPSSVRAFLTRLVRMVRAPPVLHPPSTPMPKLKTLEEEEASGDKHKDPNEADEIDPLTLIEEFERSQQQNESLASKDSDDLDTLCAELFESILPHLRRYVLSLRNLTLVLLPGFDVAKLIGSSTSSSSDHSADDVDGCFIDLRQQLLYFGCLQQTSDSSGDNGASGAPFFLRRLRESLMLSVPSILLALRRFAISVPEPLAQSASAASSCASLRAWADSIHETGLSLLLVKMSTGWNVATVLSNSTGCEGKAGANLCKKVGVLRGRSGWMDDAQASKQSSTHLSTHFATLEATPSTLSFRLLRAFASISELLAHSFPGSSSASTLRHTLNLLRCGCVGPIGKLADEVVLSSEGVESVIKKLVVGGSNKEKNATASSSSSSSANPVQTPRTSAITSPTKSSTPAPKSTPSSGVKKSSSSSELESEAMSLLQSWRVHVCLLLRAFFPLLPSSSTSSSSSSAAGYPSMGVPKSVLSFLRSLPGASEDEGLFALKHRWNRAPLYDLHAQINRPRDGSTSDTSSDSLELQLAPPSLSGVTVRVCTEIRCEIARRFPDLYPSPLVDPSEDADHDKDGKDEDDGYSAASNGGPSLGPVPFPLFELIEKRLGKVVTRSPCPAWMMALKTAFEMKVFAEGANHANESDQSSSAATTTAVINTTQTLLPPLPSPASLTLSLPYPATQLGEQRRQYDDRVGKLDRLCSLDGRAGIWSSFLGVEHDALASMPPHDPSGAGMNRRLTPAHVLLLDGRHENEGENAPAAGHDDDGSIIGFNVEDYLFLLDVERRWSCESFFASVMDVRMPLVTPAILPATIDHDETEEHEAEQETREHDGASEEDQIERRRQQRLARKRSMRRRRQQTESQVDIFLACATSAALADITEVTIAETQKESGGPDADTSTTPSFVPVLAHPLPPSILTPRLLSTLLSAVGGHDLFESLERLQLHDAAALLIDNAATCQSTPLAMARGSVDIQERDIQVGYAQLIASGRFD